MQIDRRTSLFMLLSAALQQSCSLPQAKLGGRQKSPPNILMLCIDDLNDWVGCLKGHPNTRTPNIDKLARRGTLFANAHAQAPICGPSRASLLSGALPSETGIYGHIRDNDIRIGNAVTQNLVFLPEALSEIGYITMGKGKIFHNGAPRDVFDEFAGRSAGFGPSPDRRMNWFGKGTSTDWGAFPNDDEDMPDIKTAEWVKEKLQKSYDKPFFIAAGFLRPHVPWHVPKKWFDLHPLNEISLPNVKPDDMDDIPDIAKAITNLPPMPTLDWVKKNSQWKPIIQAYLASVSFVDHCVGIALNALEQSLYAKDTIVVLWSDHGYHLGEKGLFQKFTLWERSTRVPLIFSGPNIFKNQQRSEAVGLIDIYPTLIELSSKSAPGELFGKSLVPLLSSAPPDMERYTISTYGKGNHAIRDAHYRYIRYSDGSEELYHSLNDPNEWYNLAGDEKYREIIASMRDRLPAHEADWSTKSKIKISPYFRNRGH